jgi:hypothetical protein
MLSMYLRTEFYIYLFIYGSTAPCWTSAAFQLLDLLRSRQDSLDGASARRKAFTCMRESTNTE